MDTMLIFMGRSVDRWEDVVPLASGGLDVSVGSSNAGRGRKIRHIMIRGSL